ncbi:MAG: ABC transporter permease [Acidobacteriota bacterium]
MSDASPANAHGTGLGRLATLGAAVEEELATAGRLAGLSAQAADRALVGPFRGERPRWRAWVKQVERAGTGTLPLVALISLLIGMILALQSAHQLQQLGVVQLVADLVAISVTRELAPLMTAILVAGRVGSSIAAELGTMKVSQEVDALTVMGIDPVAYLVVPRLGGLLIAVPCLTFFADALGILGGSAVGTFVLGLGFSSYWADSIAALSLEDLWSGVVKSFFFGGLIGLVACQQGLETRGGASAVGRSTTAAVVRSIILIIAADLIFTAWFYVGK